MQKKALPWLLSLALLLTAAVPLPVWAGDADIITDITQVQFRQTTNYIQGIGMHNAPDETFLYEEKNGGLTFVQHLTGNQVTVADFDKDLNFIQARYITLEGFTKWGTFLAAKDYNYIFYAISGTTLRVNKYDKDWKLVKTKDHSFGNTTSFIHNDFDAAEENGQIVIATNHYMKDGHEANLRLQLDANTLTSSVEQSGEFSFPGFASHAYVPEVVMNNGAIYIFDRADSSPGKGLYVSTYKNSLDTHAMTRSVPGIDYSSDSRNWGNLGNAIPAAGGFLAVCNQALYSDDIGNCNVFLHYGNAGGASQTVQVNTDGGASTPVVAALTNTTGNASGFALWGAESMGKEGARFKGVRYAPFTISNGSLSVGSVANDETHYISDCEPIAWNGKLIWTTAVDGELAFNMMDSRGNITDKRFHKWTTTTKEPTCTTEGSKKVYCSYCGEVQSERALPAPGHDLVETPEIPATCTKSGEKGYFTCSRCGRHFSDREGTQSFTVSTASLHIPAKGHSWDDGIVTVKPDCKAKTDGKRVYTCTSCGEARSESTSWQSAHEMTHYPAKEGTCETQGNYEYWHCSICGKNFNQSGYEYAPFYGGTGHTWDNGTVTAEKTCETPEITTFTCTECGQTTTRETKAAGHTITYIQEQPATCTEPGHTTYRQCTVCGRIFSSIVSSEGLKEITLEDTVLKAKGHYWVGEKVIKEAGCTEPGIKTAFCLNCGETLTEEIAPAGHTWTDWKVTKAATTSKPGEKSRTCRRCDKTETQIIPATGEKTNPFLDVFNSDYYYDPVLWAVGQGITSGTSNNTFSPAEGCTRAQVVTFLWRAAGEPKAKNIVNPFRDVAPGYFYDAVLWAVEQGITNGTATDAFSPSTICTRAQIVTFLYRFAGKPNVSGTVNPFRDVNAREYYAPAVLWAVKNNITQGTGEDTFSPLENCRRCQIVTFLYRYMNR